MPCLLEIEQLKLLTWTATLVLHYDLQTSLLLGIPPNCIPSLTFLPRQQKVNFLIRSLNEILLLVIIEGHAQAKIVAESS